MRPNLQQQQLLQQYLGKMLMYRETYNEFYDHIMSALEEKTDSFDFEEAVSSIIKNDFGGMSGLSYIENKYQVSVFEEMRKKYFSYAFENLKFPGIIIIGLFAFLAYNLFKQPWFNFLHFIILFVVIRAVPFLLQLVLKFKPGNTIGAPIKSIKSGFFRWLNRIPAFIVLIFLVLDQGIETHSVLHWPFNPYILAFLFTLTAFHSFTFYKVCRDDIKSSLKLS